MTEGVPSVRRVASSEVKAVAFITLVHAAMKSATNFAVVVVLRVDLCAMARSTELLPNKVAARSAADDLSSQ